jgi:hypothetical protein
MPYTESDLSTIDSKLFSFSPPDRPQETAPSSSLESITDLTIREALSHIDYIRSQYTESSVRVNIETLLNYCKRCLTNPALAEILLRTGLAINNTDTLAKRRGEFSGFANHLEKIVQVLESVESESSDKAIASALVVGLRKNIKALNE